MTKICLKLSHELSLIVSTSRMTKRRKRKIQRSKGNVRMEEKEKVQQETESGMTLKNCPES